MTSKLKKIIEICSRIVTVNLEVVRVTHVIYVQHDERDCKNMSMPEN